MNNSNFYVLLVASGKENIITESIKEILDNSSNILLPTRELYIKKAGITKVKITPLFSGYLFLQTESITPELITKIKQVKGFYRFLNSNQDIVSLTKQEVQKLGSFLKKDYCATISKVIFNDKDKIVVKEGPLKEFEGQIIKVDKRKQRAKVQLSFYNESHTIDFSFQDLEKK